MPTSARRLAPRSTGRGGALSPPVSPRGDGCCDRTCRGRPVCRPVNGSREEACPGGHIGPPLRGARRRSGTNGNRRENGPFPAGRDGARPLQAPQAVRSKRAAGVVGPYALRWRGTAGCARGMASALTQPAESLLGGDGPRPAGIGENEKAPAEAGAFLAQALAWARVVAAAGVSWGVSAVSGTFSWGVASRRSRATASISLMRFSWLTRVAPGS